MVRHHKLGYQYVGKMMNRQSASDKQKLEQAHRNRQRESDLHYSHTASEGRYLIFFSHLDSAAQTEISFISTQTLRNRFTLFSG